MSVKSGNSDERQNRLRERIVAASGAIDAEDMFEGLLEVYGHNIKRLRIELVDPETGEPISAQTIYQWLYDLGFEQVRRWLSPHLRKLEAARRERGAMRSPRADVILSEMIGRGIKLGK